MRRLQLVLLAFLALPAGCHRKEPPIGAAERHPDFAKLPASAPPAFIGRWASAPSACGDKAWVFDRTGLRSPGSLGCTFTRIDATPAGYTVLAMCTIGKAAQPGRMAFTLTGQGTERSLTIDGGPFPEPIALGRCPDEAEASAEPDGKG